MQKSLSRSLRFFASIFTFTSLLSAHLSLGEEDMSKPVITVEKKKDAKGNESLYMYIDGVKVHETDTTKQPLPPIVTPGEKPAAPPFDAVVLFDGTTKSFSKNWTDTQGGVSKWNVVAGAMESVRGVAMSSPRLNLGPASYTSNGLPPLRCKATVKDAAIAGSS